MSDFVRLPGIYAPWIESLLGGPIPAESRATCDDCAMAKPLAPGEPAVYDPTLKCCTAWPTFPNYLVGRVLREGSSNRMRALVTGEDPGIVTPLGVGGDSTYYEHYTGDASRFGRDPALRCPFLADGADGKTTSCSVWSSRPSTCTAFYCRTVRGRPGVVFWGHMLRLLTAVEDAVRRWCVLEVGLPYPSLAEIDERLTDPESARAGVAGNVWGPWTDRRVEFFEATAALADGLTWEDVERIGGAFLAIPARLVIESYQCLIDDALPASLAVGEHKVVTTGSETSCVTGFSPVDVIEVPNGLLRALPRFEGRSTEEALRLVAEEEGLTVDRAQVRILVDLEILRPAGP